MKHIVFTFLGLLLPIISYAANGIRVEIPAGSIIRDPSVVSGEGSIVWVLTRIESILLYGVTPVVVIGVGLYIAYELFLADGNEEANKKAWKSITYGSVGLIAIALSYGAIRIILSLSI